MLTYQIRPRVFRLDDSATPHWPAECTVRLHFSPKQPFGTDPAGGRTTVQFKAAKAHFNANNGAHWIESSEPLSPLDVTITSDVRTVTLHGHVFEMVQRFDSLAKLDEVIVGLYFALPMTLNVQFADPPAIERVDGNIGDAPFRRELRDWRMKYDITTQERQERRFVAAWEHLDLVGGIANRRFLAALHYFHVACRLSRSGATAGEFVAEQVLNLAKALEVLFPPGGDGKTRDAVRSGLTLLGYSDEVIESEYIPALALRNEIDVGHVSLALFTPAQLAHIHAYTERAEGSFRALLSRALEASASGHWNPARYEQSPRDRSVEAVLARLARDADHGAA